MPKKKPCWCGRPAVAHNPIDTDQNVIRYCGEHNCACSNGTPKPDSQKCESCCSGYKCTYGCGTCYCENCH